MTRLGSAEDLQALPSAKTLPRPDRSRLRDGEAVRPVVAARYGRRDFVLRRALLGADSLGLLVGLVVASQVSARGDAAGFVIWGALSLPVWWAIFKIYGLYDRDMKRISHSALDDLPWLFHSMLVGILLLWAFYRLGPDGKLVLAEVLTFAVSASVAILAFRAGARRLVKRSLGFERVLLVGRDQTFGVLVRKMRAHPEYGLEPVGLLGEHSSSNPVAGLPNLGATSDFPEVVRRDGIERVVVSHGGLTENPLLEIVRQSKQLSLKVSVLPQMVDVMGPSVEIDDVEGVTVLGINPPVLARSSRVLKRSLDLVGSAALLILATPLLGAIAIGIKLDSRGPLLFSQRRVGKGGQPFQLLKFRTMVEYAEERTDELMSESQDEYWLKLERDPRITRVGRVLRYTSLDELPQLWNVLKGQMSLVGPRPLIESEDCLVGGWARSRLDLMPGITGSWQVLGRTNIPFEEMVKLDYLYVTNWSLWGDIRLLLRTLPAVLTRRGAN